jgi:hypothetical protein
MTCLSLLERPGGIEGSTGEPVGRGLPWRRGRMCMASGLPVGLKAKGESLRSDSKQEPTNPQPTAKHVSLNAQLAPHAAKIVTMRAIFRKNEIPGSRYWSTSRLRSLGRRGEFRIWVNLDTDGLYVSAVGY